MTAHSTEPDGTLRYQTYINGRWCDAAGDAVRVEMKHGKVARWVLERVPPAQPPTPPP